MSGLFTLLIIGLVIYMLFSKNGGIGCCGGHHDHRTSGSHNDDSTLHTNSAGGEKNNVIDLSKEQYKVLSDDDN